MVDGPHHAHEDGRRGRRLRRRQHVPDSEPVPIEPPDAASHRLPQPGTARPELQRRRGHPRSSTTSTLRPPSSVSSPPARSARTLAMPAGLRLRHGQAPPAGPGFGGNRWSVLYMVMNHKADTDSGVHRVQVTYTDDAGAPQQEGTDPSRTPCRSGWTSRTAGPTRSTTSRAPATADDTDENVRDFTVDPVKLGAPGGRIVAGGGHVHGGAYELELSQPTCGDRTLADLDADLGQRGPPVLQRAADPPRAGADQHERVRDPAGLPDQSRASPCG